MSNKSFNTFIVAVIIIGAIIFGCYKINQSVTNYYDAVTERALRER